MAYDPYAYGYGYDPYGQDPYGQSWEGYEEPQEDTESQKLRKEQEMIEAIESNRLYLRKIRKRCVKEDFADLGKMQMFLFEFLIETLEVNTKSELALIPESEEPPELVARIQFLDTPQLEIREKGEKIEGSDSVLGQTEYMETVGNAGIKEAFDPGRSAAVKVPSSIRGSTEEPTNEVTSENKSIIEFDTKWENSTGKSLLFSKSALEIIQGIDKTPVKLQISRCVAATEEEEEEGKNICEPLGYALVRLPDHFCLSVLQSCKPGVILPVSCIHRQTCTLKTVFGGVKGELQVFVRLSCFGSVITTSFQSVGPERRYVFKPSPLPDFDVGGESEVKRDMILKPIVADEEVAIGITVVKNEDLFQKTVLWKENAQNCECLDTSSDPAQITESSLRMPRPSDTSLCRKAKIGKQVDKSFCGWHDLVAKEIKNNPGGNCGCLDDMKVIKSAPRGDVCRPSYNEPRFTRDETQYKPSRIEKLMLKPTENQPFPKVREKKMEPIKGLGIEPEPSDCNCDCPQMRRSLEVDPMMKYTWQIK